MTEYKNQWERTRNECDWYFDFTNCLTVIYRIVGCNAYCILILSWLYLLVFSRRVWQRPSSQRRIPVIYWRNKSKISPKSRYVYAICSVFPWRFISVVLACDWSVRVMLAGDMAPYHLEHISQLAGTARLTDGTSNFTQNKRNPSKCGHNGS